MSKVTPRLVSLAAAGLLSLGLLTASGCAHDRSPAVPASAMVGSEGDGQLSYLTGAGGTAYVYDATDDKLLWSSPVARGQTITLDPVKNLITVDGKTVQEKLLHNGHKHRIFFERMHDRI